MEPASTALTFIEGRLLLPFWITLSSGAFLACAAFWALPWPPRGRRVALIAGAAALWLLVLGYLLVERRLVIDPQRREVRQAHQVFGLGPEQIWTLEQIAAVQLRYAPGGDFALNLRTDDGRELYVRRYGEVLLAEREALALAGFGGWPAQRQGYRVERPARAGAPQRFRTAQGKQGVVLELDDVVRVFRDASARSDIRPLSGAPASP